MIVPIILFTLTLSVHSSKALGVFHFNTRQKTSAPSKAPINKLAVDESSSGKRKLAPKTKNKVTMPPAQIAKIFLIMFSTSIMRDDLSRCLKLGANCLKCFYCIKVTLSRSILASKQITQDFVFQCSLLIDLCILNGYCLFR